MANSNYSIDNVDLTAAIGDLLKEYGDQVAAIVNDEVEEFAKEGKKRLTRMSKAKVNGKRYATGWAINVEKYAGGFYKVVTLYNKKQPGLTQLLEFGHPIIKNGVKVGQANAFSHIAPVNDWVVREFPKLIERKIKNLK